MQVSTIAQSTRQAMIGWAWFAAITLAPCMILAQAPASDDQPANSIRIRVIGPDKQPIEEAAIHVSVWTNEESFPPNQDFISDGKGEAVAPLPQQITILRIWARKENHVPLFAQWWPERQADGNEIPQSFTFDLPQGTTIGGQITDEKGDPIRGAHVEVMRASPPEADPLGKRIRIGTWLAEGDDAIVTDAQGRWELGNVPGDPETVVRLKLSHPDFIDDANWGDSQAEQSVIMPLLRDQSAVIRMKRGHSLRGRVTDAGGQAIANAVVVWGDDPYFENGSQEVRTGADGSYQLPPRQPGPIALTVIAKGWAPQRRDVEISADSQPVDFQLHKGKTLQIHFEDYEGNPIAGTYVGIDQWRGVKSLYNHKHPNVLDTGIPRMADDDGNFIWDWAPEDAVTYSFAKQGFEYIDQREIAANDELVVVLLQPKLTVQGVVVDAVTGKPVEAFVVAIKPSDRGRVTLSNEGSQFSKTGSYSIESDPQNEPYLIRIEAKGYQPFVSEAMTDFYGTVKLDAKLQPLQ